MSDEPIRVAVLDDGTVRLHELDLPPRGDAEIDVDITLAAICGSDLHTVLGHRPAAPLTGLGHEAVGVVCGVRDRAVDLRGDPLRVGDRVALSMITSCGACDRCHAGLSMKCRSLFKYGHSSVTESPYAIGMLASRVRMLPGTPVLRIPDEIADAVMVSAGCAVATAAAVVAAAAPRVSDEVLVLGAGAVGFYCAAMFATLGCAVTVRDPSTQRRDLITALDGVRTEPGASEHPHGDGPAIVVEASGNPAAVAQSFAAVAIGGHVVGAGSVSPGSTNVTVDPAVLVTRRVRFSGVHNYNPEDFRYAVDWLAANADRLPVDQLLSTPYPLDRIIDAFDEMRSGRQLRVGVTPSGAPRSR